MKMKLIFILTFFLLLQYEVQALSLGTLVKNFHSQVLRGETATFKILLWNSGNSSFPIKIKPVLLSKDLSVIINPKEFIMNASKIYDYSSDNEKEYINTPYGLIETKPIEILVKVSNSAEIGTYDFYINLAAGRTDYEISTIFEKTFKFNIDVISHFNKTTTITTIQKIEEKSNINETNKDRITGMFSNVSHSYAIFIVALIISIFLICWTMYKYE